MVRAQTCADQSADCCAQGSSISWGALLSHGMENKVFSASGFGASWLAKYAACIRHARCCAQTCMHGKHVRMLLNDKKRASLLEMQT